MRAVRFVGLACLLISLPAFAQAQQQGLDVPVYQGAQKTLDLHLTEKDFLPWIKQGVEFLAAMAAQKGVKLPPDAVRRVVGNLREVRAVEFVLPAGYPRTLLDFYDRAFPAERGWRTNLWTLSPDGSSAALVKSKGHLEEVVLFFAGSKKDRTEAFVARTLGMVDLGALFKLLSTVMPPERRAPEGKGTKQGK